MEFDKPKPAKHIDWSDHLSTIFGALVAIANAYVNVDWSNFEMNPAHLMPLAVSAVVALGGYMTSIKIKRK